MARGERDHRAQRTRSPSEVDVDSEDDGSLADAISDLGDRLDWDSLTEYGREHWGGREPPKE